MSGLRVVVFDRTDAFLPRTRVATGFASASGDDGTARGRFGLAPWWRIGGGLHAIARRAQGAAVAVRGVSSWGEALGFALEASRARALPIREIQAWGHGGWGFMDLGRSRLDREALARASDLAPALDAIGDRLAPDALVWLRCCSAFGAPRGRAFAGALAERLAARVAGHTYVIGALQSGARSLAPGELPRWPEDEGLVLRDGVAASAKGSGPREPRTIGCLRLDLPPGW